MDGRLEDNQGDNKRANVGQSREIDGSTDEKSGGEANDEGPRSGNGRGVRQSQSQFSSEVANIAAECQQIALSSKTDGRGGAIKATIARIHRLTFLRRKAVGLQRQMMIQAGPVQIASTASEKEAGEEICRLSGQIDHLSELLRQRAEAQHLTELLRQARAEAKHDSLFNAPNKSTTAGGTPARGPTPTIDLCSTSRADDEDACQLHVAPLRSVGAKAEKGAISGEDGTAEEQNSPLDWSALEIAIEDAAQALADVQDNPSPPRGLVSSPRPSEKSFSNFSQYWAAHPSSSEEAEEMQRTTQDFDLDEDFAQEQLVLTDLALYNYETYHSMSHGTASVVTVDASSAGILGWAACTFDAAKNPNTRAQEEDQTSEQQLSKRESGNAQGIGAATDVVRSPNPTAAKEAHPPSRADEEEATQLQVALLQSLGVKAKSVGLMREPIHPIGENEAYDYYYSSDEDGEWSEDSQAGDHEVGGGGPGGEEADISSVRRVSHGTNGHGNTKQGETKNSSAQGDSSSYSFCGEGSRSHVGGKNSRESSQTSWQNIASLPVPPSALQVDRVPDEVRTDQESVATSEDWSVLSIDKE